MAIEFPLATRLTARDSASNVLTGLGQHARKIGRDLQRVGRQWSVGVSAPVAALGAATAVSVFGFRREMNKVQALTGATGESFQKLRDQAKGLGRTMKFSAAEAAGAQAFLAQAGFKTNQIYGAMPATLALAAAAGTELAETGDLASNVMTQFGIRAENLGRAGDVLTRTFSTSNTDLLQLGAAMKFVGPVANRVGVQFETVNAIIGAFSDAGIQGEMAGTSLRGALNSLIQPSGAAIATFKKLGIAQRDILTEDGKIKDFVGLMERLSDIGATQGDVLAIFGQRPGTAVGALLGQLEQFGRDRLRSKELDLFQNSDGVAAAQAATRENGIVGAFNRVRSAFEGAKIAAGDSGFEGALTRLADGAAAALNWFSALQPATQRVIAGIAGATAAVGPLVLGLGTLVRVGGFAIGGLGWMKTAAFALGGGLTGLATLIKSTLIPTVARLGMVVALTPFGQAALLVSGLAAAGVVLYKNWDTVKDRLGSTWESIREMFGSGVAWITERLSGVTSRISAVLDFVGLGGEQAPAVDNSQVAAAVAPVRGQDGRVRVEVDVKSQSQDVRANVTAADDVDLTLEQGPLLGVIG
ncbi:MAG: phage tail tape measure protein [Planctomycetota bacterium]